MTLRRMNKPFTVANEFDQFFNDFFFAPANTIKEGKRRLFGETPAVNIQEGEEGYNISVAAPGMKKEDFKIEINEGVLTISSEKSEENESSAENYTRREYNYSSFERKFTMPENAQEEEIKAAYTDGILKIEIPKMKEAAIEKKKLIEVS
ncbi:Hsp20/alpha crystallin family protein [Paracrocinitomix mangrovi]|uniref:Hsp20/alpha crystallin family protein n=1 Tax=Paracrocinitomix mangrovi TaxID=2862509 RepID=UPI001EDA87AA|nr:Hsp20/alpha crystallin family protein [Paracrocinitomix mangrovi]UKN02185.1 Hsp20/alpha crystallin family protein [Paracrocinitomix mangrovi]